MGISRESQRVKGLRSKLSAKEIKKSWLHLGQLADNLRFRAFGSPYRDAGIHAITTLGPEVWTEYLHRAYYAI